MSEKVSVLFVCLGNICRSTMSEGVFQSLSRQAPYRDLIGHIDSCGTGAYHVGDSPDSRTMSTLRSHGIKDYSHAARQLRVSDFEEFDYIFAMDSANLRDTKRKQQQQGKPNGKARVMLFGEYSGGGRGVEEVDDPYYSDQNGFEVAYEQAVRFSTNFLDELREARKGAGAS